MKLLLCITLGLCTTASLCAQQLTRFAVVDLPRVYITFFRDSRAVREYEEKNARVQIEIDRMTKEINSLKATLFTAEEKGDRQQALSLESEIYRKTEFLREYYRTKNAELEDEKSKLVQSGTFLDQVYDEIRFIAESEGYSMVLNSKENDSILWYSRSVDITDRLINNLRAKR